VRFERWEGNVVLRMLAFCGRASWGIYMGHVLVHEILHLAGVAPETGPDVLRVAYAMFLLALGIVLVLGIDRMRRSLVRGGTSLGARAKRPPTIARGLRGSPT